MKNIKKQKVDIAQYFDSDLSHASSDDQNAFSLLLEEAKI